eukprot:4981453-Karenia_brevis.AAC.1
MESGIIEDCPCRSLRRGRSEARAQAEGKIFGSLLGHKFTHPSLKILPSEEPANDATDGQSIREA